MEIRVAAGIEQVTPSPAHGNLPLPALSCCSVLPGALQGGAGCAWLWQLCPLSFHEVWHLSPSGTEGLQHFKSIESSVRASQPIAATSSPRSWSKERGKALLGVCVGQTLPASTGRRGRLQELPEKSSMCVVQWASPWHYCFESAISHLFCTHFNVRMCECGESWTSTVLLQL